MDDTAESRIKPENYITIQGWMVTELGLKGVELIVYACIYGFSQSGETGFIGSPQYLAEWSNSTRQGVYKALGSLIQRRLIRKRYINTGGIDLIQYTAERCQLSLHEDNSVDTDCQLSLHEDNSVDTDCQLSLHRPDNSVDTDCQLSLHNNNSNKDKRNNSLKNSSRVTPTPPTVEEVADYCRERGNGIDPQRFVDYYSVRKWRGKDGPIEDWKAIIRLWETNGRDNKTDKPGGSFDEDEFMKAAFRRSYGDDYELFFGTEDNV